MDRPRATPPIHNAWLPTLAIIAGLTLWHLAMAAVLPATQDEAYYFDWARSLAWGYFDHPPGVALMGLGTLLEPGSALAARIGGVLAGTLTLLVLARLYRNSGLTDRVDLAVAVLLAGTTLPGLAGGFILTPDTPLTLAWALALHESERALAGERRRWLTAGIATGLGLLSKYTMVVMGPVFLWAILSADPGALRTRWPYLGGLLALLLFAPNLIWNANNDWLTLRFQFGHGFATETGALLGEGASAGSGDAAASIEQSSPGTFGERAASLLGYLGTQLGFWGLIALPILSLPWIVGHRDRSEGATLAPHARALLLAAALFPFAFFALVSLGSDVEANWPAMYLLAVPPLLAPLLRTVRTWVVGAAALNLLLVTLYSLHGATGILPLPDSQNRILRETHGFRCELAAIAAGLDGPVYADRYQDTAMLRFYQPDLAATQWPGITRPSEYLRGQIAPTVGPDTISHPFWLLTRRWAPPQIPGFEAAGERIFFDCANRPLIEAARSPSDRPPCGTPLHVWRLYPYQPADRDDGDNG